MIPKVIYQTWYKKDLPDNIKKLNENMLSLNKDYAYYLFDDNDIELFIQENYDNNILKAYNMLNVGAAKADLWRYLILYKNGGIYLDIDSEIYSNLDELISSDDHAIISREGNHNLFVQWCLIFSPNHPLLDEVVVWHNCMMLPRLNKAEVSCVSFLKSVHAIQLQQRRG